MQPDLRPDPTAPSLEDEVTLLQRVSQRDRRAFELLYRVYYRRLTRFLEQMTRRPQLVEEIVDDTMLVVWRKAGTFNGASRVSTWIFAIAYRKALKALRRGAEPTRVPWDGEPTSGEGPETELIERESRNRVRRALTDLSTEQRAVVELTYYHGYAYREIAQIVRCPVDTVKTRMFHARRKLKALLDGRREERS
ncbi:MAG TPA: sigma-70 family RNA polymerase sigma factor [Burkholderiales bacterium]|nr:sigma-70 family RNA polymerase sigma factor [Burkholderiales bacterium]